MPKPTPQRIAVHHLHFLFKFEPIAIAKRPVLAGTHALEQELHGEEFVVRALGIGDPGNKVGGFAHPHIVARRREAESGNEKRVPNE